MVKAIEVKDPRDLAAELKLLASADLRQPGSLGFYHDLVIRLSDNQRYAEAQHVLDRAQAFSGGNLVIPLRLIILRIEIEHAAAGGKNVVPVRLQEEMSALHEQCQATKDKALIEECHYGKTGHYPDQDYKNCGGIFSAFASPAEAAKCANNK